MLLASDSLQFSADASLGAFCGRRTEAMTRAANVATTAARNATSSRLS